MIVTNRKIEKIFWIRCLGVYLCGFILFSTLRIMRINFYTGIIVTLLSETIAILICNIIMLKNFRKACNSRTIVMLNCCEALPYISEMQTFLEQSKNLWKYKQRNVEFLLANAYRYYGDYEKARDSYHKLSIQKIPELQKLQIELFESSMYMDEENLTQAHHHLQQFLSSPKKDRFLQISVMKGLAIDLQILEAYMKYKNNDMNIQNFLPILQSAREEYTATKLWKYHRIINVLEKEGRIDVALPYRKMISNITGDFLLFQKDICLEDGEVHE